jgi:hypothetical protein
MGDIKLPMCVALRSKPWVEQLVHHVIKGAVRLGERLTQNEKQK